MSDLINRQDAKDAVDMALDIMEDIPQWAVDDLLNALDKVPSIEPEKVLVAEVKLSKEQIQDAVDKAVEKMKAELEPCDFCKHKDDCGDMALYCPSERRTDE